MARLTDFEVKASVTIVESESIMASRHFFIFFNLTQQSPAEFCTTDRFHEDLSVVKGETKSQKFMMSDLSTSSSLIGQLVDYSVWPRPQSELIGWIVKFFGGCILTEMFLLSPKL